MPNDPALVPEAYVRECAAVCWMRLADADVTSTRPAEELRAVLHLMATQAVGEGLRAWTLALWGLAHDPLNQRALVRLGAIPVVNARISEVRTAVVDTVRSLATNETAANMDLQMSILVRGGPVAGCVDRHTRGRMAGVGGGARDRLRAHMVAWLACVLWRRSASVGVAVAPVRNPSTVCVCVVGPGRQGARGSQRSPAGAGVPGGTAVAAGMQRVSQQPRCGT